MTTTTTTQTTQYGTPGYTGWGYGYLGRLPIGVAIIAILVGIAGFVFLLDGLLLFLFGFAFLNVGTSFTGSALSLGRFEGGIVLFILGAIMMGVASGLWHQRLWALALAIIVTAIVFILELLAGALLGTIIALVILIYLIAVH